ncbi:MAG TPA: hypothetical protein VGB15_12895 [Longimicrobium sp.]
MAGASVSRETRAACADHHQNGMFYASGCESDRLLPPERSSQPNVVTMSDAIEKTVLYGWIEVESGAPLPPEAPPWSDRCELVTWPGLAERHRKGILAGGGALLAGSVAVALLVGTGASAAGLYAGLAAIVGLALLFFGLIGVPPSAHFVSSPTGRYVYVPPPPPDPADVESPDWLQRAVRGAPQAVAVTSCICVVIASVVQGVPSQGLPMLGLAMILVAGPVVNAVRRHLKSEAEVSKRFLQAADPRVPLSAPAESLPAGGPAPAKTE